MLRLFLKSSCPALLLCGALLSAGTWADDAESARDLHERLFTLDSHLDTPVHLSRPGWNIMARHDYRSDRSQVDYPRLVEGGLDAGFWVIYTRQGEVSDAAHADALDHALQTLLQVREMVARHHDHFGLALTANDAERIAAEGRHAVLLSMENGYPLGTEPRLLETFQQLGLRMFGPVHFRNNALADSSTDPEGAQWDGLSDAGKAMVAEANRLGLVLDASHASDAALDDMLALSETPIILSHSGAKAIYDHPRNVDDQRLLRLAEQGGVIQINAYGGYLRPVEVPEARREALDALRERYGRLHGMPADQVAAMAEERAAIEMRYPIDHPDLDDFMAHLLHALELLGPDHVGIGADWDGGGGVDGMWDVATVPRITQRLLDAGYSEADLAKIWGGNALRVLRAAEAHAAAQTDAASE